MIKHYTFNYGLHEAEVCFKVDTNKFTTDHALEIINFFGWPVNDNINLIDLVITKIALCAIQISSLNNYNVYGIKNAFCNYEGFPKLDGSSGIELNYIANYEFDEDNLDMTVIDDNN